MKTKKILILFLACILLIACKPTNNKQNERQESIVTEEQDSLTTEEQEFLASLDSVMDSYEEEVIVVVDKNRKSDKPVVPDDKEGFITIIDARNGERFSDVPREYINDTLLIDSLQKIAKTAEKFIKWYLSENCPINQSKLFAFSDSLGYYIFDVEYEKYYLKELQNTGVVSDSLIRSLSKTFEQIKVNLENEKFGPEPDGLSDYDVDIIFNSQDIPDPFLEPDLKIKSFNFWGSNISVRFSGGSAARLIYENGDWKIISGGF